jgi:hypothetical protein
MYSSVFSQCDHTVRLTDTYGDGWNGGAITVSVNGIAVPALTNLTMATNSAGPEDFTFSASTGDIITITETAGGAWPSEMRVELFDGASATITAFHNPVVAPGTDGTAFCTVVCDHTVRLTDTYGDGWNGGAITVSVNGIAVPALTNFTMATNSAGPEDFTFSASTGDIITITETAGGAWPSEMRVELFDGASATITAFHNPVVAPGTDGTAFCSACSPQGSCAGLPPFSNTDHITNVDINSINNASGCSAYSDYTATSTNVNVGSSYILTINVGGGLGFGVYTDCAGWVDWNNDGDYLDANESLSFFDNGTAGPMTALVSVPAGTALGNKNMRLRSSQGGISMTSCNTTANGEVEDYTLNVNSNIASTITASIIQGLSDSTCLGSFLTLNAVPISIPSVTSYQWYYGNSTDAETDANIDVSQNGVYSIIIENSSGEAAMATFTLTVNDPPSGGVIGNYTWCNLTDSSDVSLSLSGNGPFSIIIEPGGLLYNNVNNGDQVSVPAYNPAPNNTTYLTQIIDANGCNVTLGAPVNEVTNGDGSSLVGWTITSNGGNGWLANGTFRTSYGWNRKFQVIDLVAAGYTTAELDTAPIIYASEQYSSVFNNGDQYEYTVTLQDAAFNTIETRSITLANVGSNSWQLAAQTFSNYGAGLRYIRYEHGGVDTEFWAGHYGTRIDNSIINLNVKGNISTGAFSQNCPLPVSLTSFEETCSDDKILITWTTISETNNDYFTLEKSSDGIVFKEIGIINGSGNSTILKNYKLFDDNQTSGISYYRLKQTDFDGKFEYHNTITSECNKKSQISIFPNPFSTNILVTIPEEWILPINVQVIDYLGRKIKSLQIENEMPTLNISLDESIPDGTYFIKFFNEKNQFIQKIIKMEK